MSPESGLAIMRYHETVAINLLDGAACTAAWQQLRTWNRTRCM